MRYDTQAIDALVDEIKGAARFLAGFYSPRANFIFAVIILGTLVAINLLFN
jgi:hypothetical protein